MAMLSNPFLKSVSHFLKKLFSTKKKKACLFHSHFLRKYFLAEKHFLKHHPNFYFHSFLKVTSLFKESDLTFKKRFSQQKKRLSQDEEKVFSEKNLYYFFENAHLKKKKRNAFLWTLCSPICDLKLCFCPG